MALYHSTFRWFASLACTTLAVGHPYNWIPPSQLQHAVEIYCRLLLLGTLRIEADGNYSLIFVKNQKPIMISKSLKTVGDWLDGLRFYRIHHSHIVNLDYIQHYIKGEGGIVILEDGSELEVSRRKKEYFLKLIGH